ncbi:MAG: two-component sensor histidine kinase [Tyzzerella sp.]|nr:two-component sensor histidine kinase [Tyzzerella sp.]
MRNKIQKSMLVVICATVVSAFIIMAVLFYAYSLNHMKKELKQEMSYIVTAIEISGLTYLDDIDAARVETRLTLIDETGEVLYDSREDDYTFQSHAEREEIESALKNGSGEALRSSETIGKMTYYYAVKLKDGMVLRASKTLDGLMPVVLGAMLFMVGIATIMIVFAYFLAKWQTARLIQPINELDLEHPLENTVYEELTPLLVKMEQQNQAKDEVADMRKEFSANVSHELKTPLTSISGYAEIMKGGLVPPEDMIRFSEKIHKEASRLIVLIEDIIKLSKLDEADIAWEKENVDLYEMCMETCNRLAFQAEKKNVHMELIGEPLIYFGVRQILDEMIYNICENAIKYNVDGGSVMVWVGSTLQGPKVVVEDTGIGIPKDQQERVFERFYRVDKSHSKETGGTGLGLSIVKHGAICHGAEIRMESEPLKGTRMEIVF